MEIKYITLTTIVINIPIVVAVLGIWVSASAQSIKKVYLALGLSAIALSSIIPLPLTNWLMSNHLDFMTSGQAPLITISLGVGIIEAVGLVLVVYSLINWSTSV